MFTANFYQGDPREAGTLYMWPQYSPRARSGVKMGDPNVPNAPDLL